MSRDIRKDIEELKKEILQTEESILKFSRAGYEGGVKKSLHKLESDLKYLSILANGAPIEKNEDRKIMDFLQTHFSYMKNLSVPV